jgi:hypothetical protein
MTALLIARYVLLTGLLAVVGGHVWLMAAERTERR